MRFICYKSDGTFLGSDCCLTGATEHVVPGTYAGVLSLDDTDITAQDAFHHPNYYLVQNGALVLKPNASALQLADAQNAKNAELSAKCDAAIVGGFPSSALGVVHTYPSDDKAQSYLGDAIKRMELDSTVTSVNFKTLDTGYLAHTLPQLQQVFKDGFDFGQAQITKYNQLKTQVGAATTVDGVNAIVW